MLVSLTFYFPKLLVDRPLDGFDIAGALNLWRYLRSAPLKLKTGVLPDISRDRILARDDRLSVCTVQGNPPD